MDVHILITETQKIRVRFLGQEDPLEEEIATGSSILAWRIPWTRGAWQATVHEAAKSQTQLTIKPLTTNHHQTISKW